jgi:hypothetical protein
MDKCNLATGNHPKRPSLMTRRRILRPGAKSTRGDAAPLAILRKRSHTIRVFGACWLFDTAFEKALDLRGTVPTVRGKSEKMILDSL